MKRFRGGSGSDALSISIYLLLIAAVLVSWMIVPALTFILFLINSAYHFGETDLRNTEGRFARAIQLMYGAALLGFFFFSHGEEAGRYLAYFGLNLTVSGTVGAFFTSLFLFLVSAGLLFIFGRKAVVADVLIVALIGTQLPLVLAFGLYYILIHSRSAWSDLGRELSLDTTRMIRLSMPFIAGGCALMGIAYWVIGTTHAVSEHPIVLLIAGLAAITLPHSLAMALMYRSTKGSRS
jgi:Brp/Blh family beta-carotene 15,15'-monooxygenase